MKDLLQFTGLACHVEHVPYFIQKPVLAWVKTNRFLFIHVANTGVLPVPVR